MTGRKLNDNRGETLVEMLASILIAALSVAVLFTCCTAAVEMGKETRAADEAYYGYLSAAEGQGKVLVKDENGNDISSTTGQVNVDGNSAEIIVNVKLYGGDGMYSYKKEADPVGP